MSDDEWSAEADENGGWGDEFEEDDSGENQEDSTKIQIENLFYEAEDARRSNPAKALKQFEECVELTRSVGKEFMDKRFKALEHIVTLLMLSNQQDLMVTRYQELLSYASDVTRNEYSDAINKILNVVAESSSSSIEKMYEITLHQLRLMGNQERMWFNINLKLCKTYMASDAFDRAEHVLVELHDACRHANGADDKSKGSQLLEVYALEFQLHSERRDTSKLKDLYVRTKDLSSEINDPRSMSVIREYWGKLFGNEGRWSEAYGEFFLSFKQYQEIGHARAKQCLKYVVIAGLLSQNQSDPFDMQEAKVYKSVPEILAWVDLRAAYERGDIKEVESILRRHKAAILDDAFIRQHLELILDQIRAKTLVDLLRPFRTVRLGFLAQRLLIDEAALQVLLVRLILDERVDAKIDQVNGVLDLSAARSGGNSKYKAISEWATAIANTERALASRLVM